MVWREPNKHGKECYFCSCVAARFSVKNKHKAQYPDFPCAIQPIPHVPCVPILLPSRVLESVENSVREESLSDSQLTEYSIVQSMSMMVISSQSRSIKPS